MRKRLGVGPDVQAPSWPTAQAGAGVPSRRASTTIRTDPVAHGREAMQLLVAQLRGQAQVASLAGVVPELVVRRSCGAVAARQAVARPQ